MKSIRKFTVTAVSVAVLGFGAGAGLAACGSSGSSSPPNAQSVLQGNGYTYDSSFTSQVQKSLGSDTTGESSLAAGSQGSNIQLVIVFTSPTEAAAGASGEQQQLSSGSGITVTSNGDVVTATGSFSAWEAQGNG
jgi:hypothetical protein